MIGKVLAKIFKSLAIIIVSTMFYSLISVRLFFVTLGKFIGGIFTTGFIFVMLKKAFDLACYNAWESDDCLYVLILGSVGLNLLLLGEFYDEILKKLNYTGSVIEI